MPLAMNHVLKTIRVARHIQEKTGLGEEAASALYVDLLGILNEKALEANYALKGIKATDLICEATKLNHEKGSELYVDVLAILGDKDPPFGRGKWPSGGAMVGTDVRPKK